MINLALEAGFENLALNDQIFELFYFFLFDITESTKLLGIGLSVLVTQEESVNCPPSSIQSTFVEYLLCARHCAQSSHEESPEKKFVTLADYVTERRYKRIIFLSRAIFLFPSCLLLFLSRLLAML